MIVRCLRTRFRLERTAETTRSMAEEARGVSDSSAALVASSINGGGCLPPPTPSEKVSETLGKHMDKAVHPEETNYRDALPTSLSWRTTTQTMMVGGLAGEVTEEELAKIPLDLTSGPPCQECLPAPAGPVERAKPVPKGRGARMSCSLAKQSAILSRSLPSRPRYYPQEGATRAT